MAERGTIERLDAASRLRSVRIEAIAALLYEHGEMLADREDGAPLLWAEMAARNTEDDRIELAQHRALANDLLRLDVPARVELAALLTGGGLPPWPAPPTTSGSEDGDARGAGRLFDPLQRMEHGEGRYGPRFLEIVEEGWERSQVVALARLFGLELKFISAGTGIDPCATDWTFGAALAAVTQPDPGDGWQLVGVHDDEDAEIVFEFVRAASARQAAGGAS